MDSEFIETIINRWKLFTSFQLGSSFNNRRKPANIFTLTLESTWLSNEWCDRRFLPPWCKTSMLVMKDESQWLFGLHLRFCHGFSRRYASASGKFRLVRTDFENALPKLSMSPLSRVSTLDSAQQIQHCRSIDSGKSISYHFSISLIR